MSPLETILGGICVGVVSGGLGALIGSRHKVDCDDCDERRKSCTVALNQRFADIKDLLDKIWKKVNHE